MKDRRPAEVFHPGEYLLDELNERGWTQTEFAEIIRRPVRLVNEIINKKKGITPDTAQEFSAALGTSAELWMNLDTAYNLWKSEKDLSPITHHAKMRSKYPLRDMVLRGWLEATESMDILENQVLRYFEVKNLDETPQLAFSAATKKTGEDIKELSSVQLAWLYRVKHIADTMPVARYSESKLRKALEQLKLYREYVNEIRHIPPLLEECGVRFVIVEPLPSSKIDGVCLWLGDSPVIGMTLRFDRIDNFWFVLRHEIEHILNGDGRDSAILESDIAGMQGDDSLSDLEKRANTAAAEFCVPQEELNGFIARNDPMYSRKAVIGLAKRLGLHPGLVAGQLRWKAKRFDLFNNMNDPIREVITPVSMTDGFGQVLPVQL